MNHTHHFRFKFKSINAVFKTMITEGIKTQEQYKHEAGGFDI